jgi:uncharacterized protein
MKVIIDMSNSPHVLFFYPIIQELNRRGHEVKIISRKHAQTLELLDLFNLEYKVIGKHAGKNLFNKFFNALLRVMRIMKYLREENPDVCLSHQSPYIIYAGFLTGKKRIYIFDNEHARLQNMLTFPLANRVVCPEAIDIKEKKFVKYPGVKEAIYLKDFQTDYRGLDFLDKIRKKKIFIRTEISTAAYLSGQSLFELVKKLSKKYQIIVSPRTPEEKMKYKNLDVFVLENPVHGPSLIKKVDLIMSGGGTMNREAAVLGKPVISLYSGDLLSVDRYLIKKGLMVHNPNPDENLIEKVLKAKIKKINFKKMGEEGMNIIIKEIEQI